MGLHEYLYHQPKEVLEGLPMVDIRTVDYEQIHWGKEPVRKYSLVFDPQAPEPGGFLYVDLRDGSNLIDRHEKWKMLNQQGMAPFITETNHLVRVKTLENDIRLGLLSENLVTSYSSLIDHHDMRISRWPPLIREASRWVAQQESGKEGRFPPIENKLKELIDNLNKLGWNACGDNLFIVVRKTSRANQLFEFKTLVGDLGVGLDFVGSGENRVKAGELYDLVEFFYYGGR